LTVAAQQGPGGDKVASAWRPGEELPRLRRTMTAERMRWYADVIETSLAGRPVHAAPNIHTDDDIARANGLPARVADGMISTNWLSEILVAAFGEAYLRTGSLRTRYARPILEDAMVTSVVQITSVEQAVDGTQTVKADAWCETEDGTRCTSGEASVRL
jgi:3-hydroxybutyryl-CoA dehydratase